MAKQSLLLKIFAVPCSETELSTSPTSPPVSDMAESLAVQTPQCQRLIFPPQDCLTCYVSS